MSLRLRLTLLYTSLLGGALLVVAILVYSLVSLVLLDQVDSLLARNADLLIQRLRVNEANQVDLRSLIDYQSTDNIAIELWRTGQDLQWSRPLNLRQPLDVNGREAVQPVFRTTIASDGSYRVLSIPLSTVNGPVGVLQVAQALSLVSITQRTLGTALMAVFLVVVLISVLVAWLVTGRALRPLSTVTQLATQITRADDLARRIPQVSQEEDEIGELITAFNQTLERLEKLFNTQRRFLADVSHELRTPLTVIKGNVGLMRQLKELDDESLSSIESEVDRLTRLVGDLLILAQAESGRLPLNITRVELDTVVLEVFQQMRILSGERLALRLVEIDQVQVMGDFDRLKQVLLNLVGNAIQYTPPGGEVDLALRKSGQMAQVIIVDTGPGIPAEDLPHIFERFYRGEKSRKRGPTTGFGLGLSIAYWIVQNHKGSIEVTSQDGKGTTFCVWLPLAPELGVNVLPELPPLGDEGGGKVKKKGRKEKKSS